MRASNQRSWRCPIGSVGPRRRRRTVDRYIFRELPTSLDWFGCRFAFNRPYHAVTGIRGDLLCAPRSWEAAGSGWHPVAPGLGSGLHDLRQRRALVRCQRRSLARRLAVDQTGRPLGVEAHNPVPDDLQPDATDPRRLRPGAAVPDRRKRQQPPNLLRVPTGAGQPTQVIASEVVSKLADRRALRELRAQHDP